MNQFCKSIWSVLVACGACVSCSTALNNDQSVSSRGEPGVELSTVRTFNYLDPLSTDLASGERSVVSNRLIAATDAQLVSRGYTRSDQPQLLVNFFVQDEGRLDERSIPTTRGSFHDYRRGRYTGWPGYVTTDRERDRGTLSVDLIDTVRGVVVWEAVADGRLGRSPEEADAGEIEQAMQDVFLEFPYRAD